MGDRQTQTEEPKGWLFAFKVGLPVFFVVESEKAWW
jgi:hypothetical protein